MPIPVTERDERSELSAERLDADLDMWCSSGYMP